MSELRLEFEKSFPIPAHWIEWSESKNRYDCHVGLADSKCAEYNKMFNVWCVQQAKIDEKRKQMEDALFSMRQQALMLREDMDGYKDPAQICQSEGVDICVGILEKALRGASDQHLTR